MAPHPTVAEYIEFLRSRGPGLRHAFVARYGPDVGSDVMGDVAEYAWEHWHKVGNMENPSGWLYRVGQSRSRRYFRRPVRLPTPHRDSCSVIEPGLPLALRSLPDSLRVAVLLTQAFGYTVREAAGIIGVSPSTVQQNTSRGLARLRAEMGVSSDV
jgi:RNA polymerase sigma-70 factor (ECF subfamily)